eukprot:TRINITY_DN9953_c0_g1_i1.p1 TRINITY_DN9953_c0_g1~~TRINITY_DN9953_c0_g1_i1.p1  ORF type:complete len:603 (+),score=120.47 TRINITY_DN9953_c0_g1_i1:76-1884(+)
MNSAVGRSAQLLRSTLSCSASAPLCVQGSSVSEFFQVHRWLPRMESYSASQQYYQAGSATQTPPPPEPRPAAPAFQRRWLGTPHTKPDSSFKVMSYNVLADRLMSENKQDLYWYSHERHLDWDTRKWLLLDEMRTLAPDVICLQEVDRYEFFEEELGRLGYDGYFKQRTGGLPDGCAILWRADRLSMVAQVGVEFNRSALEPGTILDRDNVAVVLGLRLKSASRGEPRYVCVATTHLLFNPKRGDVKLAQIKMMMETVQSVRDDVAQRGGCSVAAVPAVLTGDFNCTPDSAIYGYLLSGRLDLWQLDFRNASGQLAQGQGFAYGSFANDVAVRQLASNADGQMLHDLRLSSCYRSPGSLVSSYHARFKGLVDYILVTPGLRCAGVLSLPSFRDLRAIGRGLPNDSFGSDHIALVANVEFAPSPDPSAYQWSQGRAPPASVRGPHGAPADRSGSPGVSARQFARDRRPQDLATTVPPAKARASPPLTSAPAREHAALFAKLMAEEENAESDMDLGFESESESKFAFSGPARLASMTATISSSFAATSANVSTATRGGAVIADVAYGTRTLAARTAANVIDLTDEDPVASGSRRRPKLPADSIL